MIKMHKYPLQGTEALLASQAELKSMVLTKWVEVQGRDRDCEGDGELRPPRITFVIVGDGGDGNG
jgi:hypothetical protein